jgi:hypothetical protein
MSYLESFSLDRLGLIKHKTIKNVSKTWSKQEVRGEISYKKLLWLYTDTLYAYCTISTSRTSFYTVSRSFHDLSIFYTDLRGVRTGLSTTSTCTIVERGC